MNCTKSVMNAFRKLRAPLALLSASAMLFSSTPAFAVAGLTIATSSGTTKRAHHGRSRHRFGFNDHEQPVKPRGRPSFHHEWFRGGAGLVGIHGPKRHHGQLQQLARCAHALRLGDCGAISNRTRVRDVHGLGDDAEHHGADDHVFARHQRRVHGHRSLLRGHQLQLLHLAPVADARFATDLSRVDWLPRDHHERG